MLQKILIFFLCLFVIFSTPILGSIAKGEPIPVVEKTFNTDTQFIYNIEYLTPEETIQNIEYIETNDIEIIKDLLLECQQLKLESLKTIQITEDTKEHPLFKTANENLKNAIEMHAVYFNKLLALEKAEKEYPIATKVWVYLKEELGYSDIVSCAIIGNMMVEVGGGTLELDWQLGTDFYGLCQWSKKWYPEAQGMTVPEQLNFLKETIEYEFNWAGAKYKKGFKYKDFITMTDLREATLAFAMSYERCSKLSYEKRCNSAKIAYDYFIN